MGTLKEQILDLLRIEDGFTDREITDRIKGRGEPQQSINQACRKLQEQGFIERLKRNDGKLGNYLANTGVKLKAEQKSFDFYTDDMMKDNDLLSFNSDISNMELDNFQRVNIVFEYFNKKNMFYGLNNKTLAQTVESKRYSKYKEKVQENYFDYKQHSIGEFLFELKNNGDEFYKNFLNKYGDLSYCKFKMTDGTVMDKKGLYIYKVNGEVKYIGRCKDNFKKRVNRGYGSISPKNCYLDGQATNCHINNLINKVKGKIEFFVFILKEDNIIDNAERKLIKYYKPEWNIALK